ncbi:hypothetical protein QR680_013317 [Steinernema hermaphroditum]|uniref:C2H2-type domain-containing protein n=1 Tax=Steinernema hermaphroditum TaxID=289476 RepID=A0AA39I542_9BILA|nr:hypothetical protein QR680_013317 [Steinernema hermaphroditum]
MQAECCVCLKTYASAVLLNNHLRIVHRNNNMWNNSLQNYATYFASNYLTDERVKKWAAPYREGAVVNCNMGLERFHLLLKDDYLRFRQNKRIDELADLLIKYSTDSFRKDKHLLRGSTTGRYRLQISHANHKSAEKKLQEGGRVEKQANGSFTVFSSATSSGRNVTFFELCSCLEQNRCRLCRVCHHNMSCDCSNVKAGVPCIHMHMTAMEHPHLLNASGAQEEAQKSTAVQARTKSQELEEAENSENLVEEEPKDDFEKKLRTLLIVCVQQHILYL